MTNRTRSKHNGGFTLVEVLATIGILIILLSVSAVAVVQHIDDLEITELDNAAREIFMAAENRAVLLSNARQLYDMVYSPDKEVELNGGDHVAGEHLYYVHVDDARDGLLDTNSIDPALLDGDFYIVYSLYTDDEGNFIGSGSVTDVVYAKKQNSLSGLVTNKSDFESYYTTWWIGNHTTRVNEKKDGKPLMGWYNGRAVRSGNFSPDTSEAPYFNVDIVNGEKLTVTLTVKDEYAGYIDRSNPSSNLKVLLESINNSGSIDLISDIPYEVVESTESAYILTWVLDSLDSSERKFRDLVQYTIITDEDGEEIESTAYKVDPGDDFKVVATITYDGKTYTDEDTDNSLFWKVNGGTAEIKYLRHLQNLSATDESGYNSGVNYAGSSIIITDAVQVGDILGDNNITYSQSSPYPFIPIVNNALESYDGGEHEIRNLTLHAGEGASVGLFAQTNQEGMTLSHIRMVNAKVSADGAASVGALAGTVHDNVEISYCWVYWDGNRLPAGNSPDLTDVLVGENDLIYQLRGSTVGGLVGVVEPYTGPAVATASTAPMFDHCLAATLIRGTDHAGGLVGQVSAGANVTMGLSYADCYLTGARQAAGLVGYVEEDSSTSALGTVTLNNCYAAGFIVNASVRDQTAGLCMGGGTTNTLNVYSVMMCADIDASNNTTYGPVGRPLTGGSLFTSDGKTHFMGSGNVEGKSEADGTEETIVITGKTTVEMSTPKEEGSEDKDFADLMGNEFGWIETPDNSHPYSLRQELETYVYPGLTALPQYGDWSELLAAIKPVGLVYYELYNNNSYGIYGVDKSGSPGGYNLKDGTDKEDTRYVVKDGYAVAFSASSLGISGEVNSDNITVEINGNPITPTNISNDTDEYNDAVWVTITSEEYETYWVLPYNSLVTNYTGQSYNSSIEIRITLRDGENTDPLLDQTYYYNPHFAKTVSRSSKTYSQFIVRSPRHLFYLSRYENDGKNGGVFNYHNSGKSFMQELDLDYLTYTGYGLFEGKDSNNRDIRVNYQGIDYVFQQPIGSTVAGGGGHSNKYNGSYNGGGYAISGLGTVGRGGTNDYQGLFGYSDTGTIQNVTLKNSYYEGKNNIGGILGYNEGGTVRNCVVDSTVTVKGNNWVAGIVGVNSSQNGGRNGIVTGCTNVGTVNGTISLTGGIVGDNNPGCTVEFCTNAGNLESPHSVGGIAGKTTGTVQTSYNIGDVRGTSNSTSGGAGGIVGTLTSTGEILNCYNAGRVLGDRGRLGGLVGSTANTPAITKCYSIGKVERGTASGNVIGYYGGGTLTNCYYLKGMAESGKVAGYGTPRDIITELPDAEAFADASTNFTGWNFTSIWEMGSDLGGTVPSRPVLRGNNEANR